MNAAFTITEPSKTMQDTLKVLGRSWLEVPDQAGNVPHRVVRPRARGGHGLLLRRPRV
jgi:hypothetical protein